MPREFKIPTEQGTYLLRAPADITPDEAQRIFDSGQTPTGYTINPEAPPPPQRISLTNVLTAPARAGVRVGSGEQPVGPAITQAATETGLPRVAANFAGDFAHTTVQNLPMLGAMAGGTAGVMLGGPAGPFAGPAGAALGAAGGANLRDIIQQRPPDPIHLATEGIAGATAEMGGQLIGKGVQKGVEWAAPKVLPFIEGAKRTASRAFQDAAAKFGITTSAAERSGSATLGQLEGLPTRVPFGTGRMREFTEQQLASQKAAAEQFAFPPGTAPAPVAVGQQAKDLAAGRAATMAAQASRAAQERVAPFAPPEAPPPPIVGRQIQEATQHFVRGERAAQRAAAQRFGFPGDAPAPSAIGQQTKGAVRAAEETARAEARSLYDQVERLVGPGEVVSVPTLAEVSQQILGREFAVRGVQKTGLARTAAGLKAATAPEGPEGLVLAGREVSIQDLPAQVIRELGLDQPRRLTFQAARDIQSRLGALMAQAKDRFVRSQLASLQAAMTRDIEAFGESQGGAVNEALAQANQFFRENVARVFVNEGGRKTFVAQLAKTKPELVVDSMRTVGDVSNLTRAMGPQSAEMEQIRRAFVQNLIDKATDAKTRLFRPEVFTQLLQRSTPEFRRALLGGAQATELETMAAAFTTAPPGGEAGRLLFGVVSRSKPEQVIEHLRTPTDVMNLRRVAGQNEPLMEGVRQAFVRRLVDAATDQTTGQFSQETFVRQAGQYPPEFWRELLGPRRATELGAVVRSFSQGAPATEQEFTAFMRTLSSTAPERVVGSIRTTTDALNLRRALAGTGQGTAALEQVQRAWMQEAIDAAMRNPQGAFNPATFVQRIQGVTPEFRETFFGPERASQLNELLHVLNRQLEFSRLRMVPGQPATGALAAAQTIGAVSVTTGAVTAIASGSLPAGGVVTAGVALLTPYGLSRLLSSPRGIRLLTEGFRLGPGTEQAARIAAQIVTFANRPLPSESGAGKPRRP